MTLQEQKNLHRFYSDGYGKRGDKHDSPEQSRVWMMRTITDAILTGIPTNNLLDIGSGPRSLEGQLFKSYQSVYGRLLQNIRFVTLDYSTIPAKKLIDITRENQHHLQADALTLPFPNDAFGLVVSNHCIDFLPRDDYDQPFNEAFRVLAPGGTAIFTFHHPTMIPSDLEKVNNLHPAVKQHWSYLQRNTILFSSIDTIRQCLQDRVGFINVSITSTSDRSDTWWQVVARKYMHWPM